MQLSESTNRVVNVVVIGGLVYLIIRKPVLGLGLIALGALAAPRLKREKVW